MLHAKHTYVVMHRCIGWRVCTQILPVNNALMHYYLVDQLARADASSLQTARILLTKITLNWSNPIFTTWLSSHVSIGCLATGGVTSEPVPRCPYGFEGNKHHEVWSNVHKVTLQYMHNEFSFDLSEMSDFIFRYLLSYKPFSCWQYTRSSYLLHSLYY